MFDWMTTGVEAAGFLILCVWVVVPIREFQGIFRRIKARDADAKRERR